MWNQRSLEKAIEDNDNDTNMHVDSPESCYLKRSVNKKTTLYKEVNLQLNSFRYPIMDFADNMLCLYVNDIDKR